MFRATSRISLFAFRGSRNMQAPQQTQHGIALLSIMLILTLMTLVVADITFAYRNQLRKTTGRQQMEQARWYAMSAEELAVRLLKQSIEDDGEVTHLGQYWATDGMVFPVEDGTISGTLTDAQSCLNVNALNVSSENGSTPVEVKVLASLLESLDIGTDDATNISWATRDWVYTGADYTQYGDDYYMSRPLPHLTSKTAMRDISEWRAVTGVTQGIALRVMPYLCAIPLRKLSVNVNTIPANQPELLSALFANDLPVEQARSILEQRPANGWDTIDEFLGDPRLSNYSSNNARDLLTVKSSYFELRAISEYSGTHTGLQSLLRRNDDDTITVVRRKFGAFL